MGVAMKGRKGCEEASSWATAGFIGGKEGIRTLEALLTLTRFPGGPLQPLEHLSEHWLSNVKNKKFPMRKRVQKYYFFLI